jgi:alpha-mannosidase
MATRTIIHLIANAHVDPVWLWDWREGLNAGLATVRTVLGLMDEFPDLTFIRGEAALYEHVERYDPAAFEAIRRHVASGRWDVVGGTYVQPDTNLPATETLCRHFVRGQRYFTERFGKPVRVAWAADSFGHAAGLPDVLAACGVDSFAFTRPTSAALALDEPAFWWDGAGGARVLAYRPPAGAYLTERGDVADRLDAALAAAGQSRLTNVGCCYGLGDHGGGPTRRHLHDIAAWAERHPEVTVLHSGLHRLFASLRAELAGDSSIDLPVHRGELNYVFRGCYSSALRMKSAYRRSEAAVARAERVATAVLLALPEATGQAGPGLASAWDAVLFNSFHDILPGSSIERACDEQLALAGASLDAATRHEFDAINRLAGAVDTTVPAPADPDHPATVPLLVFNPHAEAYDGPIEAEVCLDDRPLMQCIGRDGEIPLTVVDAAGQRVPFQVVATEHRAFPQFPWRRRFVFPATLPPLGWAVYRVGFDAAAPVAAANAQVGVGSRGPGRVHNQEFEVVTVKGAPGVTIERGGRPFLHGVRLGACVFDDRFGSWGNMSEVTGPADLGALRATWQVVDWRNIEAGPQRAALWVRFGDGGANESRLDLTFHLYDGRDSVDVSARLMWDERAATLKLVLPADASEATYDVPGGTATRGAIGEVPGGRWAVAGGVGFVSDALYGFDLSAGALRPTIARAAPFAATEVWDGSAEPHEPVADVGEHRFRFRLASGEDAAHLRRLARELEQPPVVQVVPAGAGALPRRSSVITLHPSGLEVLAVKPAEDPITGAWVLRVRNPSSESVAAQVDVLGQVVPLGPIAAGQIVTWRIAPHATKLVATRLLAPELESDERGGA